MDRRGFLTTTFAGGLAVTTSACAGTREGQVSEVPLADDELEHKLARLDATLERMNHKRMTRWFHEQRRAAGAPPPTEGDRERLTHEGELMRASLRSALLLSSIAELPEANRSDPRVTARVQGIAGETDYALLGTLAKLRSLDAAELAALDDEFAGSSPGMDVTEHIDALSDQLGVPAGRRLHLRRMAKHLDWKLERERFSSVVGEVVGGVKRAVEAAARSIAEAGSTWALAGPEPDPSWIERTREVVRFYAPADAPGDAPSGEPEPADAPQAITVAPATSGPAATPASAEPAPAPPPEYAPPPQPAPGYGEAQRAKIEKQGRAGKIMAGTGAGLLVLGGVSLGVGIPFMAATGAVVAVSLGGVGITIGMILLVIGIVLAVRAKRDQPES